MLTYVISTMIMANYFAKKISEKILINETCLIFLKKLNLIYKFNSNYYYVDGETFICTKMAYLGKA